jgi:hypothetical protein
VTRANKFSNSRLVAPASGNKRGPVCSNSTSGRARRRPAARAVTGSKGCGALGANSPRRPRATSRATARPECGSNFASSHRCALTSWWWRRWFAKYRLAPSPVVPRQTTLSVSLNWIVRFRSACRPPRPSRRCLFVAPPPYGTCGWRRFIFSRNTADRPTKTTDDHRSSQLVFFGATNHTRRARKVSL